MIINVKEDKNKLEENLNYRIEHQIAPGFKDSKKPDKGIGDLIIWQTILELSKDKKKDIVFVTNEKKMIGSIRSLIRLYIQNLNCLMNLEDSQVENLFVL